MKNLIICLILFIGTFMVEQNITEDKGHRYFLEYRNDYDICKYKYLQFKIRPRLRYNMSEDDWKETYEFRNEFYLSF